MLSIILCPPQLYLPFFPTTPHIPYSHTSPRTVLCPALAPLALYLSATPHPNPPPCAQITTPSAYSLLTPQPYAPSDRLSISLQLTTPLTPPFTRRLSPHLLFVAIFCYLDLVIHIIPSAVLRPSITPPTFLVHTANAPHLSSAKTPSSTSHTKLLLRSLPHLFRTTPRLTAPKLSLLEH